METKVFKLEIIVNGQSENALSLEKLNKALKSINLEISNFHTTRNDIVVESTIIVKEIDNNEKV